MAKVKIPKVLKELSDSDDPVDRLMAHALKAVQDSRASRGLARHMGYEPRDILKHGAIYVIEKRIRKNSDGFNDVGPEDSYEAIVIDYPDRFEPDVVELARQRLGTEREEFAPTADRDKLDQGVQKLLSREFFPPPKGQLKPQRSENLSLQFLRDPKVKAFVLREAKGCCEACGQNAPFKNKFGVDYLEVHHVKTLADEGSDKVSNAVALCPNCHRAAHHSADAADRASLMYQNISRLIPE